MRITSALVETPVCGCRQCRPDRRTDPQTTRCILGRMTRRSRSCISDEPLRRCGDRQSRHRSTSHRTRLCHLDRQSAALDNPMRFPNSALASPNGLGSRSLKPRQRSGCSAPILRPVEDGDKRSPVKAGPTATWSTGTAIGILAKGVSLSGPTNYCECGPTWQAPQTQDDVRQAEFS